MGKFFFKFLAWNSGPYNRGPWTLPILPTLLLHHWSTVSVFQSKGVEGLIWFLERRLLSTSPTLCFKETQISAKQGHFLLKLFFLNSGLRKFRHGISIVETCYQLSSSKLDAQSVINWTVVGQLSWQYLRAPTLDRSSLSQWSSSSVYSTIPSRGSISDSWYLFDTRLR